MRCNLVVGLAFSARISALRTGTSDIPTTTKFAVTWQTNDWNSVVRCVANEDVRHRWSGKTHTVRQGGLLVSFRVSDVSSSWEIELEDEGRHVPQFECQMVNTMNQVECTATSTWVNAGLRQDDGTTPCVVIENKTPVDSRKDFYIRAFTTLDSAQMRCIAAADIQQSGGQIIKQGADLFQESEWELTLTPDQTPDDYQRVTEIMLEDFNWKIHGFVCSVIREGKELCKAESWDDESITNIVAELGGCKIQITNDPDLSWPVYYPKDWGQRHFQITALSNSDAVSKLICWPTVDVETKTGIVTVGTRLIDETMPKSEELRKIVTIIHRQKFDISKEHLQCQITVTDIDAEGKQTVLQLCTVKNWENFPDKSTECEMQMRLVQLDTP